MSAAAMPAPPASTPANAGPVASAQDSIAPAASDQDAGASGPDAGASGPIGRRSWTKSMAPQNAKFAGNELEVAPVVMTSMFAPPNTTCPGSTICEVCHGPRHRRGQPRSGHALGRRKTGPSLVSAVFFRIRSLRHGLVEVVKALQPTRSRSTVDLRESDKAPGAPPQRSLYACSFKYGYYIQTYKEFHDRYLYDI